MDVLDKYDHQQLTLEDTTDQQLFVATYEEEMNAIRDLKDKFGGSSLFGNEKDDAFKGSIGVIYQSFGGVEFYRPLRKRQQIFYIFLLRIIPFRTVINGSQAICSFGFWKEIDFYTGKMVPND